MKNQTNTATPSQILFDYEALIVTLDEFLNYMESQNAVDDPTGYELTFCNALAGIITKHDYKVKEHSKALREGD